MNREAMKQIAVALRALMTGYMGDAEDAIAALEAELAKPEQEPYFCKDCGKGLLGEGHIHTCSPQVKRQWVGLTQEDRDELLNYSTNVPSRLIDWTEAKLKELNT
jgi:hypothetical protein